MGFYVRKAVSFGPIRFNISKSGVGVSAGVPGMRVGFSPRGSYVHVGRGGLYYRKFFTDESRKPTPARKQVDPGGRPPEQIDDEIAYSNRREIESLDALRISDSNVEEVLDEIRTRRAAWRYSRAFLWLILPLFLTANHLGGWDLPLVTVLSVSFGVYIVLRIWDFKRKTSLLVYQLDDEAEAAFDGLMEASKELGKSRKLWHLSTEADINNPKYNAGAVRAVTRAEVKLRPGKVAGIRSNVTPFIVPVGRQVLAFLPDVVLVLDANGSVGGVSYSNLGVSFSASNFVEEDSVPKDTEVVGRTWKFVNKSGGPDRRFKVNPEIPVVLYAHLRLTSQSGLNEELKCSHVAAASAFATAIARYAKSLGR